MFYIMVSIENFSSELMLETDNYLYILSIIIMNFVIVQHWFEKKCQIIQIFKEIFQFYRSLRCPHNHENSLTLDIVFSINETLISICILIFALPCTTNIGILLIIITVIELSRFCETCDIRGIIIFPWMFTWMNTWNLICWLISQ